MGSMLKTPLLVPNAVLRTSRYLINTSWNNELKRTNCFLLWWFIHILIFSFFKILFLFFKYMYWLCYYSCPIYPPSLHCILPTPSLSHSPTYSSFLWVILISSLASTFPILFLPSPCLFSTYPLLYEMLKGFI